MVRLRLKRVGMKQQPHYRLVAIDQRTRRDGKEIEILGNYNPKQAQNSITVNVDRLKYWLGQGAQPSETVSSLIHKNKLLSAE